MPFAQIHRLFHGYTPHTPRAAPLESHDEHSHAYLEMRAVARGVNGSPTAGGGEIDITLPAQGKLDDGGADRSVRIDYEHLNGSLIIDGVGLHWIDARLDKTKTKIQ
jgi:hypothetical protein